LQRASSRRAPGSRTCPLTATASRHFGGRVGLAPRGLPEEARRLRPSGLTSTSVRSREHYALTISDGNQPLNGGLVRGLSFGRREGASSRAGWAERRGPEPRGFRN
jgi:hypothetical protein